MIEILPERRKTFVMNLIVTILTPLFLEVCGGDASAAWMAAVGMVNEYRARNQCDLLTVAQIILLGMASLHALNRSMDDNLSIPDMLALQRSGNALTRTGEALKCQMQKPPAVAQPYEPPTETPEKDAAVPAGMTTPATSPKDVSDERLQQMWAIAMVSEASEISATLHDLPPEEQRAAKIRVGVLRSMANELLTGVSSLSGTAGPKAPDAIPPPL